MATFNRESKTFAEVLDFTRSTTATFFDSDGVLQTAAIDAPRFTYAPDTLAAQGLLIEEARTNLLSYPRRFDNAAWVKNRAFVVPFSGIAPDGSLTATKIVENTDNNTHELTKPSLSVTSGQDYTAKYVVKAGERNFCSLTFRAGGGGFANETAFFDLSNGVVGTTTGSISNVSIQPSANGFYEIIATAVAAGSVSGATVTLKPATADGTDSYAGDGTSGIYIWHAQLEEGSNATSVIPSGTTFTSRSTTATYFDNAGVLQTAAIDEARDDAFGYDSDGNLQPIGLLLEGASTNLLLYSEDLTNVFWDATASGDGVAPTVTADQGTGASGAENLDRVQFDSGESGRSILRSGLISVNENNHYISFYAKSFDSNTYVISIDDQSTLTNFGNFTITPELQLFTALAPNSSTTLRPRFQTSEGILGTSRVADILLGEIQLEEGEYPTSYIKTEASQVTRAADISSSPQVTRAADDCSRTLGAEFNASEFTVYMEIESIGIDRAGVFEISDGSENNRVGVFFDPNVDLLSFVITDGTAVTSSPSSGFSSGKIAVSFDGSEMKFSVNGSLISTDSYGGNPQLSIFELGTYRTENAGQELNSTIQNARIFPRALTEAELIALTTPEA